MRFRFREGQRDPLCASGQNFSARVLRAGDRLPIGNSALQASSLPLRVASACRKWTDGYGWKPSMAAALRKIWSRRCGKATDRSRLENRRLGLGRLRPATVLANTGLALNLAKSHFLRQLGSLRRVVGRDHGMIRRQVPFLAILRRHQTVPRQVTSYRLKSFAVLQTDQKVRGDRPADRHCGRFHLDLGRRASPALFRAAQPLNAPLQLGWATRPLEQDYRRQCSYDFSGQLDRIGFRHA